MELQNSPRNSTDRNGGGSLRNTAISDHDEQPTQSRQSVTARQRRVNIPITPFRSFSNWYFTWISRTIVHGPEFQGGDPRDYLALERTYLGWLRTSIALVSLGVVVTQLFVLKDLDRTKGIILGCLLAGSGIFILFGAAIRYFRAQELLAKGKALTGGWEAIGLWLLLLVVIAVLFLVVVIEV